MHGATQARYPYEHGSSAPRRGGTGTGTSDLTVAIWSNGETVNSGTLRLHSTVKVVAELLRAATRFRIARPSSFQTTGRKQIAGVGLVDNGRQG